MSSIDHAHWAQYLLDAVDERRDVQAITKQVDNLSIDDGYAIQAALIELYIARGDSIAGAKLGLTSVAKQEQMGVDEPCYGVVLQSTVLDGPEGALDELIHPRAEGELVFILAEDLAGPGVTADDVLDATEKVVGGIEVIDSRFEKFSFTLEDVIGDNTSAARVAIGSEGVGPREMDLAAIDCFVDVNGETVATATGADLLGSPAGCMAMLANHLGKHGQKLEAGWFVMAGAPSAAQPLAPGTQMTARYGQLGSVSINAV